MRLTLLLTAGLCVSASCASRGQGARCPTDGRAVEATVCRSGELRRLDRRLASRYSALLPRLSRTEADALRDDQRQWLQERDEWCSARAAAPGGVERCLANAYRDRLNDLERLESCRASGSNARPAACRLRGEWTVWKVRTGGGVQALQENDSTYLNKVLRADPAGLRFATERCDVLTVERTLRSTRQWFEEQYDAQPSDFGWEDRPLARSLVLRPRCRSGRFGPTATGGSQILVGRGDEIGLTYYDGAFLVLRRSR